MVSQDMDNKISGTWSTKETSKKKMSHKNSTNSPMRKKRPSGNHQQAKQVTRKRKMKMKYKQSVPKICFPFSLLDFLFKSAFSQREKSKMGHSISRPNVVSSKKMSKLTKGSPPSSELNLSPKQSPELPTRIISKEVPLDDARVKKVIGNFKFSLLGPKIPKTISQIKILLKKNPELKSQLRGMLGDQLKKKKMKAVRDLLAPDRAKDGARRKRITASGNHLSMSVASDKKASVYSTDESDEWTSDSQNLSEDLLRQSQKDHIKLTIGDKHLSEVLTCECLINESRELASEIRNSLKKQSTFESLETSSNCTKVFSTETIVNAAPNESLKQGNVASKNFTKSRTDFKESNKKLTTLNKPKRSTQAKIGMKSTKSNPSKVNNLKPKVNTRDSKKSNESNSEKSTLRWLYEKFFSADSVDKKAVPKQSEKEKSSTIGKEKNQNSKIMTQDTESSLISEKKTKELKEKYKQWLKVAPKEVQERFQWNDYVKVISYVNQLKKSTSKKDQETKKVLKVWLKTFSDQINAQPLEIESSKYTLTDLDDKNLEDTKDTKLQVKCDENNVTTNTSNEIQNCGEEVDLVSRMDAILKELFVINRRSSLDSSIEVYMSPRQTTESSTAGGRPRSGFGGGDSPSKVIVYGDNHNTNKVVDTANRVKKLKSRRERNGNNKRAESDTDWDPQEKFVDAKCGPIEKFPNWVTGCLGDAPSLTVDNVTMDQVKEMCSSLIEKLQQHCNRMDAGREQKAAVKTEEKTYQIYTVHTLSHSIAYEAGDGELATVTELTDQSNPETKSNIFEDQGSNPKSKDTSMFHNTNGQGDGKKIAEISSVYSDHDSGFVSSNINFSIDDLIKVDPMVRKEVPLIQDTKETSDNTITENCYSCEEEWREPNEVGKHNGKEEMKEMGCQVEDRCQGEEYKMGKGCEGNLAYLELLSEAVASAFSKYSGRRLLSSGGGGPPVTGSRRVAKSSSSCHLDWRWSCFTNSTQASFGDLRHGLSDTTSRRSSDMGKRPLEGASSSSSSSSFKRPHRPSSAAETLPRTTSSATASASSTMKQKIKQLFVKPKK